MSLANLIALVSSVNADPSTQPEINVEPEIVETIVGRNLPKPVRGKKASESAAPIHNSNEGKAMVHAVVMPEKGTLDARGFILAVRRAKDRSETIQAIAAYCGYDNRRDFGTQDQEARAKAQREIRGPVSTMGPSREEQRAASRSAAGFVAGMPKPSQKLLANLRAREQSIAEAMIDAKTEEERSAAKVALSQVRQAIDELVG